MRDCLASMPQEEIRRSKSHCMEKGPRFLGGLSVELPGIEPGSFVTLPGLLRAQFAQNLCSALRIGRTRPDDGPSHQ